MTNKKFLVRIMAFEEYMISARSFREDKDYRYAYELNQISNQVEYQIVGKGRSK